MNVSMMHMLFQREDGPVCMQAINKSLKKQPTMKDLQSHKLHTLKTVKSWAPNSFWSLFFSLVAHTNTSQLMHLEGRTKKYFYRLRKKYGKSIEDLKGLLEQVVKTRQECKENQTPMLWINSDLESLYGSWYWVGMMMDNPKEKCIVCQKETKKKCGDCKYHFYCSSNCSYLDWDRHKNFCSMWTTMLRKRSHSMHDSGQRDGAVTPRDPIGSGFFGGGGKDDDQEDQCFEELD